MKKLLYIISNFPSYILYILCGFLRTRLIYRKGVTPYLERYYLGKFGNKTFYIHRFVDGDDKKQGLHNHPWFEAWSLILWGNYIEYVRVRRNTLIDASKESEMGDCKFFTDLIIRILKPFYINSIMPNTYHRVELPTGKDGWTLFVHTERHKRGWEFRNPENMNVVMETIPHDPNVVDKWGDRPRGFKSNRLPFYLGGK